MGDYSLGDLVRATKQAGFSGLGQITACAVSMAEDGGMNLKAVFVNNDKWHSRDRGPWQINDHWHAEVPDSCAFDLNCAAQAAYRISNKGTNWSQWATFQSGAYKAHLSDVQTAVGSVTSNASSGAINLTKAGSGLASGIQVDQWGIGQAISDAVGYSGASLKSVGDTALSAATVYAGILVMGVGALFIGWLFLTKTNTGKQAVASAERAAGIAAQVVR